MTAPERIWLTEGEMEDCQTPPEKWSNPDKCAGEYVLASTLTAHQEVIGALVGALGAITFEDDGKIRVSVRDHVNITHIVAPALAQAKEL